MLLRPNRGIIAAAALLGACADSPIDPSGEHTLTIVRGDGQIAAVRGMLPETLVVAVRDADGRAVPAVPVDWSGADAGAVDVLDSLTRPDGTARARWLLEATTEPQSLAAAVPNGARPAVFTARVSVATIAITPGRLALWPGDTAELAIVPYDAERTPLTGELRVESVDGDVVRVVAGTRVVANQIGVTLVRVSAGDRTTYVSARVTAPSDDHELAGTLRPLIPGTLGEMRVVATTPFGRYETRTDSGGDFRVRLRDRLRPTDVVRIDVEPVTGEILPARLVITAEELPLSLVMLPSRWRIERGTFAGQVVDISIDAAATAGSDIDYSFWFGYVYADRRLDFSVRTWHPDSLPARVAIARALSPDLMDDDSTRMWQRLDQLEAYLGRDLFEPIPDDDFTMTNLPPRTVAVALDKCCGWADAKSELTTPAYTARVDVDAEAPTARVWMGTIRGAVVNLGSTSAATFVWHEMFHVLGAGHGCGWLSIQSNCPDNSPYAPTPSDVAYLELAWRLRPDAGDPTMSRSIAAALIGERARARRPWW